MLTISLKKKNRLKERMHSRDIFGWGRVGGVWPPFHDMLGLGWVIKHEIFLQRTCHDILMTCFYEKSLGVQAKSHPRFAQSGKTDR